MFASRFKLMTQLTLALVLLAIPLLAAAAQAPNFPNPTSSSSWATTSALCSRHYHRGLAVGETPNIDRIGNDGAIFTTYYASRAARRGAMPASTRMHPLRTGTIPPSSLAAHPTCGPGAPALAWFLRDLGYNTGEFGKNHLGDHTDALPTAHGFHEFWGYLYHLDAMQGVKLQDINKTPTEQTVAPPSTRPSPACLRFPAPWIPRRPCA